MKKVNVSGIPNVQQMLNMAANLKEKFHQASTIEACAWCFDTLNDSNKMVYRLYVADKESMVFNSWSECQKYYFKIIKEAK